MRTISRIRGHFVSLLARIYLKSNTNEMRSFVGYLCKLYSIISYNPPKSEYIYAPYMPIIVNKIINKQDVLLWKIK